MAFCYHSSVAKQVGIGRNKSTQAYRGVAFPALSAATCEMMVLGIAQTRLFLPTSNR